MVLVVQYLLCFLVYLVGRLHLYHHLVLGIQPNPEVQMVLYLLQVPEVLADLVYLVFQVIQLGLLVQEAQQDLCLLWVPVLQAVLGDLVVLDLL